jgi:polysaccharide chain length determinant protein (PEP-CTERM system associated)
VLPGKQYSPEDIFHLIVRRAWLIIIPIAIGTAAAVTVGERLPRKYRSETLIMVVPQRIPEAYVKAAATMSIEDRLATLQDQLLSRSRLEQIILDLDLYPSLRRKVPMEEVVLQMRTDITLRFEGASGGRNKDSASFRILYVSNEPKTAQKTAERLASLFIEDNIRDRANISEDTNRFLESQLQDARRRLEEQEKKVEQYRLRYSGELPSQASANLQAIQNAQLQVQSLREASDRARERRLLVERQLADLQIPEPVPVAPAPTPLAGQNGTQPAPALTAAQQLEAARERLRILETQYKPTHPDVLMFQRTVRELEAKVKVERAEARQPSAPPPADAVVTPAEAARQKRLRDLKLQLDDIDRELAEKQQQEKDLRAVVTSYQAKLDAVPTRESDLVELTRDYNTLQTTYQSLLAKREESNLAANLERRSIGEQFRILDPARVPERPFSPNQLMITAGGAAGGLVLGLLLVGLGIYRKSSLEAEEDVIRLCQLPVLASIPLMVSARERRTATRWSALKHVAAAIVVLVCVVVIAFSTLHLR